MVLSPLALAALLGATIAPQPGQPITDALTRLRPGDTLQLPPGTFHTALGRLTGVNVRGAGAGLTEVIAPEGADGAQVVGAAELSGLTLRAGAAHCALKVIGGGHARLRDLALSGDACALFVDGGAVEAEQIDLRSAMYGLLQHDGEVAISGATIQGDMAGVGLLRGSLTLSRAAVVGPSRDAAISVSAGQVSLDAVVISHPGPSGIAIGSKGRVVGRSVSIAGATEQEGNLGDCVQSLGGDVHLAWSDLSRCGGAALELSRGRATLDGVDLQGGGAGCLALVDGARADLQGNLCTGHGPGLVLASGSKAQLRMNRWKVDPVLWVECATGARAEILYGEHERAPCQAAPKRE
jgi:hypothetical protein